MQLDYISLFSGIEAASVAWEPLGWNPVAFAEVEPFPSAVLAARWPDVPNLGDVTEVDWSEWNGRADLVIGGSPCQSFSIAGLRKGLADPRGNLMLEYLRACYEIDPEWVVWENVPGVLSADGRRAFQAFLEAVVELWPRGGVCWRVLDAQFFGVAQRRRRVFAVVNTRDWRRSLAVLQEPGGMFGDNPPSREKRQEVARAAGYRAPRHLRGGGAAGPPEHAGVAGFMGGQSRTCGSIGYQVEQSPTLRASASGTNSVPSVLAFAQNTRDEVRFQGDGDMSGALSAQPGMKQTTYVMQTANTGANGSNVSEDDVAYTLDGANGQRVCTQYGEEVAGTLAARADSSPCADRGQNVVCLADDNGKAARDRDLCGSLKVGGGCLRCARLQRGRLPRGPLRPRLQGHGQPGHRGGRADMPESYALRERAGGEGGGKGPLVQSEVSGTLTPSNDQRVFHAEAGRSNPTDPNEWIVRGLTPVECERLQGFPDGHTDLTGREPEAILERIPLPGDGKKRKQVERNVRKWCGKCPDGPRYKACGNSMAVPVIEWLGRRIEMVDELVVELMLEGGAR